MCARHTHYLCNVCTITLFVEGAHETQRGVCVYVCVYVRVHVRVCVCMCVCVCVCDCCVCALHTYT